MKNFKELVVWQKAIDLVVLIYEKSESFPDAEKFGLTNQLRRAAVSVPSNIAEGHMRHTANEFSRFLRIALGSTAELETQILIAGRLGYVSEADQGLLLDRIEEVAKMTAVLAAKVRKG